MPRRQRTAHRSALTDDQTMELCYGPGSFPRYELWKSDFADEEERERAWWVNRERLLAESLPGDRPWAWWRYESGRDPEGRIVPPAVWLVERDLLSAEEEATLLMRGAATAVKHREYRARGYDGPLTDDDVLVAAAIWRRRGIAEPD